MAHQYLARELESVAVGDTVAITGAEARHAATVSRVRVGEQLAVANGRGLRLSGVVSAVSPQQVDLVVDAMEQQAERSPRLWLVQALAKGDRDELAIQAATELGVSVIVPWQAARSVSRWDAKAVKQRERWQSIVDEAAKQSLRAFTPEVLPLHSSTELAALADRVQLLLCVPGAAQSILDVQPGERDIALVVGPEGGIAPEEIARLEAAGALSIRLGSEVLRTSTAGPAALAVLNAQLGRW